MFRRIAKKFLLLLPVLYAAAVFISVSSEFYKQYAAAAAAGKSAVVLPNGREVGGDFITFYAAGLIFRAEPAKAYDIPLQLQTIQELVQGSEVRNTLILPYVYPPPLTALFSQLALLEILPAYLVWLLFSIGCAAAGLGLLMKAERIPLPAALYLAGLCLGFAPLLLDCLAAGQTSCLGILIIGLSYYLLRTRRDFAAGLVLGLGCYKPPLFGFIVLGLLIDKRWRCAAGFTLSAAAFNLLSVILIGGAEYLSYLEQTSHYRYGEIFGPNLYLPVHLGVGGFSLICRLLDPSGAAAKLVYAALIVLALYWYYLRRGNDRPQDLPLRFAGLIALSVWLSPQSNSYDLSILLAALVLAAAEIVRQPISGRAFFAAASALLFLEWLVRPAANPLLQFLPTAAAFAVWLAALLLLLERRASQGSANSGQYAK